MFNDYLKKGLLALGFCVISQFSGAQTLVHYWSFNTTVEDGVTETSVEADLGTGTITYPGTGTGYMDGVDEGTLLNAQEGELEGNALRPRNPSDTRDFLLALPTTGYSNVVLKFATTRTNSGATEQLYSYSLDGGTTYITTGLTTTTYSPTTNFEIVTLDFSAIEGASDNPDFIVKINFGGANASSSSGNNRFDNITLAGDPIAGETLVHYWNFNDMPEGNQTDVAADFSLIAGTTSITYPGTGDGYMDDVDGDVLNAQNGDEAGLGIRPRNPSDTRDFLIAFPTTGYEDVVVKFATTKTNQGASLQIYSYSLDGGETYINTGLPVTTFNPVTDTYSLVTLDFSGIDGVADNPDFIVKVNFGGATASGSSGNNRFDNITVFATPLEGTEDTTAPIAVFTPSNAAVNLAVGTNPSISFNEAVRLIDGSAITNTNVDALVELRLDDASGSIVPFDATVTGNTITIDPASDLLNGQQYYVALLGNTIEDMSDNAVAATVSATFTTIAVQTEFAAGDMAFVAYRMNATNTEDEVALVTFVNITPGTFLTLTDSKYTTNAVPQCADGIIWTATDCVPAGSVITIQTGTLTANTGTVTGGDFGLSSGGDQVIVYAGTNVTPSYITALTSNGWAETNLECGGSVSMIPDGLDNTTVVNTSTSPGAVEGNTVNAYYNGIQDGTVAELKAAIINPANWVGAGAGTPAQEWPAFGFPGAPTVQSATVLNNTTIELEFNNELDTESASTLANYTGVDGLASAEVDGNVVTLTFGTPFAAGTAYTLMVDGVEDTDGLSMTCGYTFNFNYTTEVSFADDFMVVNEESGTLNFAINLASPAAGSVDVVLKAAPWSTATAGQDFTFASTTLNFTGTSPLINTIEIPVINDTTEEQHAEYFVLSLENPVNVNITGETLATIYIRDNDRLASVPNQDITLEYVGSFDPSGAGESTCEIVVYDKESKRLFTTSAVAGFLDIIDFEDPTAPEVIESIDMNPYGGVTSVAVHNGIVAVASPNEEEHLDGSVVFFNTDGEFIAEVTVGALPDNISFTPDGTKVLTANEGQPNSNYSIDPEGSVSIIDISGGVATLTQANVNTLLFTAYNAQEEVLVASGVRKLYAESTMSQDFEPEYITTSADSQTAWVTLQENNAIAEISLATGSIEDVWALGTKDMSVMGNGFDISDNNNEVLIANWPVKSYYIPDAVANYSVGGVNYIITANEGDEKEYDGFEERTTIGNNSYTLDAAAFPHAPMLKKAHNAGRFRVTNLNGLTEDGMAYEEIYSVGTRSFSIFNADTQELVFDSGDDFEMYTAATAPFNALFNSDSEENNFKGRSRAKGPEPEGVTIATIADRTFAFISLERIGGVMVYDVTDPANVQFVDYKNSRSTSAYEGDHGPEGITYINAADSPDGKEYIIVANEISGTLSVYEVDVTNLGTGDFEVSPKTFVVFPNPSVNGIAYFNRAADIEVYDYSGKLIHSAKQALTIDTSKMAAGVYIIKTSEGIVKKLLVK